MTNENSQQRDLREKIVRLIQSIGQAPRKEISGDELQKLKTAASRLDQMLKDAAEAENEALKSAAFRLDQLLSDIRSGKDVAAKFRRRNGQNRDQ